MANVTAATKLTMAGPVPWFRDLVWSEWIKFRATLSSYLSLAATVVLGLGVGILIAGSTSSRWPHMTAAQRASVDAMTDPFHGFEVGQLVIGALGVLIITSEYSTGLIRTALAAAPQRRSVLMAKAVVIGAVALVVGEVTAFVTFFVTQDILQSTGRSLSISAPGALRGVAAMGMYMAVVALIGLALGTLLRHTAGAISALFALVFLAQDIVGALPSPWNDRIGEWLPGNLAGQVITLHPDAGYLSQPVSFAVLLAYPVVLLIAAAWRLGRSDA